MKLFNLFDQIRNSYPSQDIERMRGILITLKDCLDRGVFDPKLSSRMNSFAEKGHPLKKSINIREGLEPSLERDVWYTLNCGRPFYREPEDFVLSVSSNRIKVKNLDIWVQFITELRFVASRLEDVRGEVLRVGEVMLSDRVLKHFASLNLDLDPDSVSLPMVRQSLIKRDSDKEFLYTEIDWGDDVELRFSAYSGENKCDACGRPINSGLFEPIVITDRNTNLNIGLLVGIDCAKKFFGIKGRGIHIEDIKMKKKLNRGA